MYAWDGRKNLFMRGEHWRSQDFGLGGVGGGGQQHKKKCKKRLIWAKHIFFMC